MAAQTFDIYVEKGNIQSYPFDEYESEFEISSYTINPQARLRTEISFVSIIPGWSFEFFLTGIPF